MIAPTNREAVRAVSASVYLPFPSGEPPTS